MIHKASQIAVMERLGQSLFPALCVSCKKRIYKKSAYSDLCERCCAFLPWRREHERVLPLLSWRFKLLLPKDTRSAEKDAFCICAMHYQDQIPFLLRALKFNQILAHAKPLGEILGVCIKQELTQMKKEDYLISSVPLSRKRQRQRSYNQAAELAKHAARRAGLPYQEILEKYQDSPRQSEFEYLERLENVAGVYRAKTDLRGQNIVLVDDILTSGATLFSARQAALEAGANKVICAVVASSRKQEVQSFPRQVKYFDD